MAFGAGLSGLAYAYFFVIARDITLYSLFLALLGLFGLKLFIMLYGRLKDVDVNMARVGVALGVLGAFGALVHGGYDLANAINPVRGVNPNLPNQIDPRGLLTFGLTGFGILKISYLMGKDKSFPEGLSYLGLLSGVLLIMIYLARLIILDPANPLLAYPILVEGFIVGPLWYLWLGVACAKLKL